MGDAESSGVFTSSNPDRKAINALRRFPTLCDVTLRVKEQAIPANRIVLASISPFFLAMFTTYLAEKHQSEVTLHQVNPAALASLVDYAYTGEIVITQANVPDLLTASNFLQVQPVIEACCQFRIDRLGPSNCIDIHNFGHSYDYPERRLRAHKFALRHFRELADTEEFLRLSLLDLQDLISDSQLNSGEEELFTAVVRWVRHDALERKAHLAQLLQHVRLPLVTRDFLLSHVEPEPLVRDSSECFKLVVEAMKYHLQPEQRHTLTTERTVHRKPEGLQPYLFAIDNHCTMSMAYNLSSKERGYVPIASMSAGIGCGAVGMDKRIYVVGGGSKFTNTYNQCYDAQVNQWSSIAPMSVERSYLGICTLGGLLYVCGGSERKRGMGRSFHSVERYDPLFGVWSSCPPMNTGRHHVCMAAMGNCLYAVGGFEDEKCLASVELWDPRTPGWVSAPSMKSPRGGFGMAAMGDVLYCTGGLTHAGDSNFNKRSCERFDARLQAWEPIAHMRAGVSGHNLFAVGSSLYSIGGEDQNEVGNGIDVYSLVRNEWHGMRELELPHGTSILGGVILKCADLEGVVQRSQLRV